MRWLAIITILIFELSYAQPIVRILYPRVDSTISTPEGPYIYKAQLSQPLNPLDEIARVEIIDSAHDSIYFKGLPITYVYHPIDTSFYPHTTYYFCDTTGDTTYLCPCKILIYGYITNHIYLLKSGHFQNYTLYPCPPCTISSDTILPFYTSTNIHLERVAPHAWNLYFGLWYIDTFINPVSPESVGCRFQISSVCNDSDECSSPTYGRFICMCSRPNFELSYFPKNGTTYTSAIPSQIYIDLSLKSAHHLFPLDSTSAWFIIRFETITGDTFIDTVRYGDPGTFWIVPPGKHIGWRRFGVMTMHTDIPSRGYTGVVEVCLMDVTNAPVIAFGEPTHLHPEGVSCYEDWVYVDSVTGDTTVIPDIIPAPPEPVCWRFGLISEVSEAERGEDELNLEVVGGYLSPIQVFYKISGVGSLELYDITGKVVLRRAITAKGSEKIAIDGLSSGVYFVRVVGEGRSVVKKVLVVR